MIKVPKMKYGSHSGMAFNVNLSDANHSASNNDVLPVETNNASSDRFHMLYDGGGGFIHCASWSHSVMYIIAFIKRHCSTSMPEYLLTLI